MSSKGSSSCGGEGASSLDPSSRDPGSDGGSEAQLSSGFCLLPLESSVMMLSLSNTSASSGGGKENSRNVL